MGQFIIRGPNPANGDRYYDLHQEIRRWADALKSGNVEQRLEAVKMFDGLTLEDKPAIPALTDVSRDESVIVRNVAARALGRIRGRQEPGFKEIFRVFIREDHDLILFEDQTFVLSPPQGDIEQTSREDPE